jgi:hypothetical protein
MPRRKQVGEYVPEATQLESVMRPEDFLDYNSPLIRYGESLYKKSLEGKKLLGDGRDYCAEIMLTEQQVQFLNMLTLGLSNRDACNILKINRAMPLLWSGSEEEDGIFNQCLGIIKDLQADDLEDEVWNEAINNKKATLLKMYALKARKDEYKENAPPATNMQTTIIVKIGGKDYDKSINFAKDAGSDEDIPAIEVENGEDQ